MLKKKLFALLLLLILFQDSHLVCQEGTLACHTEGDLADTPRQCDLTNHFVLADDQKSCVKNQVEGCQLAAFNEVTKPCLLCEAGMIFDVERQKCTEVPENKKVENCKRYNATSASCEICEQNFFVDPLTSSCVKVETEVESCEVYSNKDNCSFCKTGFYLIEKKCLEIPTLELCHKVTDRECQVCDSGFLLDRTWNSIPQIDDSLLHSIQQGLLTLTAINTLDTQKSVCPAKSISRCLEYDNSSKCKECEEDYFVNSQGKCEKNPLQPINFCFKYTDENNCLECHTEYYLKGSPALCAAVTTVENCDVYRKDIDQCKTCVSSHYFNENTKLCVERTRASIENCETYDPNSDACLTCAENSTKTTPAGHKCLSNPQNCEANSLVNAGDSGEKHTCSQCIDSKFYIDNDGQCKTRNVENCSEYTGTTNNCSKCNEKYWLDGSSCSLQNVQNCKKHSENINECEVCNDKYQRENATTCSETNVDGCTKYEENTNNCQACDSGKVVVSNKCEDPTQTNCQKLVPGEDKCEICEAGYYAHADFSCKLQELDNCVLHKANKNECLKCSLGYHISSNTCAQNTTQNCASYIDSEDKCASCVKNYYYDSNKQTCERSDVEGCIEFEDNQNVCKKCEAGRYLKGSTCEKVNKADCIDYTPNTNTCIECSASHYLNGSGESAKCEKRTRSNCIQYEANTNNCTKCNLQHKVVNNECIRPNLGFCVFTNQNFECTQCGKGYYPNTSGVCVSQPTIPDCVEYSVTEQGCSVCSEGKIPQQNKLACIDKTIEHCESYDNNTSSAICTKCQPKLMKKLESAGTTCGDITDNTNCFTSAGTTDDECDSCKPGFLLKNGNCNTANSVTKFDANCIGSNNFQDAAYCTNCKDGFYTTGHSLKRVKDLDPLNCVNIDHFGVCTQCKEYFELQVDKTCSPTASDKSSLLCIQTEENSTKTLAENNKCAKCNFGYRNKSGECLEYPFSKLIYNCGEFAQFKDECLACKEGHFNNGTYYRTGTCESSVPSIANCKIWSSDGSCLGCEKGFEFLPASPGSCKSQSGTEVEYTFDEFMDPTGSKQPPNLVSSCKVYMQSSANEFICVACSGGLVAIVNYDSSNSTAIPIALTSKDYSFRDTRDIVNQIVECVGNSVQYTKDGVKHSTPDTCIVGYKVSPNDPEHACLQKASILSKIDIVNRKSDDSILDPPIFSLSGNIEVPDIFASSYYMKGSFQPDVNGHFLRYNAHFPYDSIVDSGTTNESTTHKLLYMYYPQPSGHIVPTQKTFTNNNLFDQFYRIPNANIETDLNCQFYMLKSELSANINDVLTHDFTNNVVCGACKPGYKPVRVNNAIGSCTEISSSLFDSTILNNRSLNMVQKPNNGWKWDISGDYHFLDLAEPVTDAQKIENCYAVDTVNEKCVFCKENFLMLNGSCIDTDNENCDDCIGRADYEITDTPIHQWVQFNSLLYKRKFPDDESFTNWLSPHCECNVNNAVLDTSTSFSVCRKMPAPAGAASDCKMIKYNDNTKCHECKLTHTKNNTTETCIPKIANCIETDDGTNCSLCESDYYNNSGTCERHYCKEWSTNSPTECLICEDNKDLIPNDKTKCSDQANSDSECLNMSPHLGFCVKSTNSDKVPVNYQDLRTNSIQVSTKHLVWDRSVEGYSESKPELIYILVQVAIQNNQLFIGTLIQQLETAKFLRESHDLVDGQYPASQFCVPNFSKFEKCETMHRSGLACVQCEDNYMLDSNHDCVPIDIANCIRHSVNKCVECDADHFLDDTSSGDGICKNNQRNFSSPGKCKTVNLKADECTSCNPGFYQNNMECFVHNASNCATKSTTENKCIDCIWDSARITNQNCVKIIDNNCLAIDSTNGKCQSCAYGYHKNGDTCEPNTAPHCKTWENNKNLCESCSTLFLYDETPDVQTCTIKTKAKCLEYHSTKDECASCEPGYSFKTGECSLINKDNCESFQQGNENCKTCSLLAYMSNNSCVLRKAADCKEFGTVADSDTCQVCSDPTYMLNTTCTRPTEKKCLITEDTEDKCKTCLGGWSINNSFTCDRNTSGNCLTYTEDNKCASCEANKYVDENGECITNTALNCKTKSTIANECLECEDNFWKDSNENNKCKQNTAENCETTSKTANECSKCKEKHFVDKEDNNKCKAHTAKFCETYLPEADQCGKCLPKHLTTDINQVITCSEYQTPNCLTHNEVKDECKTCKNDEFYLKNNGEKMICQPREVKECKTYKEDEDKCIDCKGQTYLKDDKCVSSTFVLNCETYSNTEDKCNMCAENYFKANSNNECWVYPDGIPGCAKYSSRTTCTACDSKHYLTNNKCEEVSNLITDCLEYENQDKCKVCRKDRYYDEATNKCILTNNERCKEFETKDTCKSCLDPYVFNNNLKKCEESGIADCLQATYFEFGNTCQVCKDGLLISENKHKCEQPTNIIDKCLQYNSKTTCRLCENGYILEKSKLKCVEINELAGSNCAAARYTEDYVCETCRLGSVMNSQGKCVQLELDHCIIPSNDLSSCLMCNPSSYMNKEGKCESLIQPELPVSVLRVVVDFLLLSGLALVLTVRGA